jgi:hypothetical protein
MTWAEFKAVVLELLSTDGTRMGAEDLVNRHIRAACLDLQHYIPYYTMGHDVVYEADDTVRHGEASLCTLQPTLRLHDTFIVTSGTDSETGDAVERRTPLDPYPWKNRYDLVNGGVGLNDQRGKISIEPRGSLFYVYPAIPDPVPDGETWQIHTRMDGVLLDIEDTDNTLFDEPAALAVSLWVKSYLARDVERDAGIHASYWAQYQAERKKLFALKRTSSRLNRR